MAVASSLFAASLILAWSPALAGDTDAAPAEGPQFHIASGRLPNGPCSLKPRIDGFEVHGLGTEQPLDLQRPATCRGGSDTSVRTVSGWPPHAVIAAEDQRFFEHPGYDLQALIDAWAHNQQPGAALTGASTLTRQLAKPVITGDERSPRASAP